MYEIKPQPVKSFIEDTSIKLPRFQRKKTWSDEKNFLLAVSIFKGYPLGVTILNVEKEGNKTTKWLLDGRQRRNALTEMYYNPEKIYFWASKYIKFKNNDQPNDLIDKFIERIKEYIELDSTDEIDDTFNDNNQIDDSVDENNDNIVKDVDDFCPMLRNSGLQLLAELLKLSHNKKTKGTGLTIPFDFSKFFDNIYYIENNGYLNCRKLKSVMKQYKEYCNDNNILYSDKDSFVSFFENRYHYIENKKNLFLQTLIINWSSILTRIDLFDEVDKLFLSASIGLIEIKDITTTDAQKIFNIINTGGTILTAAEILSAKPSWNIPISNPSQAVIEVTEELYKKIDVETPSVVRWDLPATLLRRIDNSKFIFGDFSDDKTGFEKEVGTGFKVLAGIIEKGITKDDVAKLSTDNSINWNIDIDNYIKDLSDLFRLIYEMSFFRYLYSWGTNIRYLLSDAICLNFIFLMYKDWIKKGKTLTDNNARKVQKNAYILFDKMVYEYVTRQWRGSSDSKISRNIESFESLQENGLFIPISCEKWTKLIDDIVEKNNVEDESISQATVTPLLYYYYFLKKQSGPQDIDIKEIEVDHIIPKTLFDTAAIENGMIIKDNLFNLGLLPKKENASKNNNRLITITDEWLKSQINLYEEINENEYILYSDVSNYTILKQKRGEKFKKVFDLDRKYWLNN